MTMKKISITLMSVLALALTSCGGGDKQQTADTPHDAFPSWEQNEANSAAACTAAGYEVSNASNVSNTDDLVPSDNCCNSCDEAPQTQTQQ